MSGREITYKLQKMQSDFHRKPDCIFAWFIDGDTIMNYNIRDVRNDVGIISYRREGECK